MTPLAAHGVVPAAAELGRQGHGVELVEHGEVAVLATSAAEPDGRPRREELLRHSDVLQEAAAATTVLPLRFGTLFDTPDELLEEFLRPRHDELAARLRELEGKVELSFRGTLREEAVLREAVRSEPEIARLREATRDRPEEETYAERMRLGELAAAALLARRAEVEQRFLDCVAPHAVATVLPDERPSAAVQASLLVRRDAVEALEAALEGLARDEAEVLEARLLGPLPPYSFVGDDGAAERVG